MNITHAVKKNLDITEYRLKCEHRWFWFIYNKVN